MADAKKDDNHWHLDKRLPVGIIVTIMIQSATIVWWAARLESRISYAETRIVTIERHEEEDRRELRGLDQRLTRIEENQRMQIDILRRMEMRLDRGGP